MMKVLKFIAILVIVMMFSTAAMAVRHYYVYSTIGWDAYGRPIFGWVCHETSSSSLGTDGACPTMAGPPTVDSKEEDLKR